MFRQTVVVMMVLVIGAELCIIKDVSAPLRSIGQGDFQEISGRSTPYPMEPEHVPIETAYREGEVRSMNDFVYRLERGIKVWYPQNLTGMKIQMLNPFLPEDDEGDEDAETSKWDAMRLKLKNLKLSTLIVGVVPKEATNETEPHKYFFVILKYAHLKFIGGLLEDHNSAEIAAEAYINDPQFETKIQDPIWKSNGNAVLVESAPISVIPERHWSADNQLLSCWKLPCGPGVDRYISMLQHKSEHAHWFFVAALMFEDVKKPTLINYVGGYVNSPEMAEISVLNFMNLSSDYKNGTWRDSDTQPGTWDGAYKGISWKAEKPQKAIEASVNKIVKSDEFLGPKNLTGVDILYYFAIGTRHTPCPISPEEYFLFLLHSIDYYWITVQVPDGNGGVYLIAIVHLYIDNIYHDTIFEGYGGYCPPETTIVVSPPADDIPAQVMEPTRTLNRTSSSEKRKSQNIVKQLFFHRKSSKVMSNGVPSQ